MLFGDFEVAASDDDLSGNKCQDAASYQCDGITLYACVDAGEAPTRLLDCQPPLVCDAVEGRCAGSPSASVTTSGATSTSGSTTGGVGGATTGQGDATSDGTVTGGAGAPPDGGECNPSLDDCCPDDPNKTNAGLCGCGVVDTPECAALRAALAHRYSFAEPGASAVDTVAGANGTVVNTQIATAGSLELAGADTDQYVDLPNGILSSLTNATIEAWLVWHGGDSWQRIFDFGNSDAGEGGQGEGTSYLFLTPDSSASTLRVALTAEGPTAETILEAAAPMSTEVATHVAVVVDDDNDTMSLYVDGNVQATASFSQQLAMIDDLNNWLGKSQFSADPGLGATLDEVRIYRAALTAAQITASFEGGPDPAFFAF